MIKKLLIVTLLILIVGCTTSVSEIQNADSVGERVTLQGTVKDAIKFGQLSGYTLTDETGSISVSSQTLPLEGSKVTVKGIVMKDSLFGYYIKSDK